MFSYVTISQINMKNIYKHTNIYGVDTWPRSKDLSQSRVSLRVINNEII